MTEYTKPVGNPYGENIRTDYSWLPGSNSVEPTAIEYVVDNVEAAGPPIDWEGPSVDSLDASVAAQFAGLEALFWDRQRKYGPANIAAFGDFGVLVRCSDKLARLNRAYTQGVGDMPDESVDDAWRDLAVYAMIALLCRSGRWPGWKPPVKL